MTTWSIGGSPSLSHTGRAYSPFDVYIVVKNLSLPAHPLRGCFFGNVNVCNFSDEQEIQIAHRSGEAVESGRLEASDLNPSPAS